MRSVSRSIRAMHRRSYGAHLPPDLHKRKRRAPRGNREPLTRGEGEGA